MYALARPLFFRTETPMHVGSGSDLGHIDLPIQREKHTDFPMIQSSSLKGALREHIEQNVNSDADKIGVHLIFGYDDDGVNGAVKIFFEKRDHQDYSGALALTDARMLLFPVKSYKGIFALLTCPYVLDKLHKELVFVCGMEKDKLGDLAFTWDIDDKTVVAANADYLGIEKKVIFLEEYAFGIEKTDKNCSAMENVAATLAGFLGNQILDRLVLVSDNVFRDFTKLSTEVVTRTKIQNETGTVQGGALFTEEYLPSESYLYTLAAAHRIFQSGKSEEDKINGYPQVDGQPIQTAKQVLSFFEENLKDVAQIGGSSTLGKGIVKLFKNYLKDGN